MLFADIDKAAGGPCLQRHDSQRGLDFSGNGMFLKIKILMLSGLLGGSFFTLATEMPQNKMVYFNKNSKTNFVRGLFLNQATMESKNKIIYILEMAKEAGFDYAIADLFSTNDQYVENVALVKKYGMDYVPRIIVYPYGATLERIADDEYFAKKVKLIEEGVELGAKVILLDYLRLSTKEIGNPNNYNLVLNRLAEIRKTLKPSMTQLWMAVFGQTLFEPQEIIGQDITLISQYVNAINPMTYPSHMQPYQLSVLQPKNTLLDAFNKMKVQMHNKGIKWQKKPWIPFIETYNFRYRDLSFEKRRDYIKEQIAAVKEAGLNGWLAWSAGNIYEHLFSALGVYTKPEESPSDH